MTAKKYPNIKKEEPTQWQTCNASEIDLFEDFFEEGIKEIKLLGITKRLKEGYKDYYAWRITTEDDKSQLNGILNNDC